MVTDRRRPEFNTDMKHVEYINNEYHYQILNEDQD